jgi:hypothetical protein
MTLLLYARFVLLLGLAAVVASYFWADLTSQK